MIKNALYLYRKDSKALLGEFRDKKELEDFITADLPEYCRKIKKAFPKRFKDNGGVVTISDATLHQATKASGMLKYGLLLKHYYISKGEKVQEFAKADYAKRTLDEYINKHYKEIETKVRNVLWRKGESENDTREMIHAVYIYMYGQIDRNGVVNNIESTIVDKTRRLIQDKYRQREKEAFNRDSIINESSMQKFIKTQSKEDGDEFRLEDLQSLDQYNDDDAYYELFDEEDEGRTMYDDCDNEDPDVKEYLDYLKQKNGNHKRVNRNIASIYNW